MKRDTAAILVLLASAMCVVRYHTVTSAVAYLIAGIVAMYAVSFEEKAG